MVGMHLVADEGGEGSLFVVLFEDLLVSFVVTLEFLKAFFMERHQKLSIWSHWRDIRPECVACYSNKIQMGESILQCILQTSISI